MNTRDAGRMMDQAHKTGIYISEIKGIQRSSAQGTSEIESDELKDFQRKETVYEDVRSKDSGESSSKVIKAIIVLLAALIWLLLIIMSNQ